MTLNVQENLTSLQGVLRALPDEDKRTAERFIAVLKANNEPNRLAHYVHALNPKVLRVLILKTASLTDYELDLVLTIVHDSAVLSQRLRTATYYIDCLVAVAPAVTIMPVFAIGNEREETYKKIYLKNAILERAKVYSEMTFVQCLRARVRGEYRKLGDVERNVLRGTYMATASENCIRREDREWFGKNMEAVATFWHLFMDSRNFSRSYVEEVLTEANTNGSALIEGML